MTLLMLQRRADDEAMTATLSVTPRADGIPLCDLDLREDEVEVWANELSGHHVPFSQARLLPGSRGRQPTVVDLDDCSRALSRYRL